MKNQRFYNFAALYNKIAFSDITQEYVRILRYIPKNMLGDITLGKGAILTRSCDNNRILGKMLRDCAAEKNIPHQESAAHRASGGTDAACIQLTE